MGALYLAMFTGLLDTAIDAGFLLERDRDAILADARQKTDALLAPSP